MLVQVNQKKRCSLKKASRILSCLEIYYKELLQISLEKKTKIKPDDNSIWYIWKAYKMNLQNIWWGEKNM